MVIPQEYLVQKFHQLAGYPKAKQQGQVIEGGCPICKEGKSWGRKRRLYYMVKDGYVYCHNCGWSGSPTNFILEVDCINWNELLEESKEYDTLPEDISTTDSPTTKTYDHTLPADSINICDMNQVEYYLDNGYVTGARQLAEKRGLLDAVNKPKTLWVSISDFIHKNRLVIPFYDINNDIVFYQSRTVFATEKLPKYLSKSGADKTLFNINNITDDIDHIFIFEGPIDACFVKNGIAVAGIQENSSTSMTQAQQRQLQAYPLFKKIWVLDSQWQDSTSKIKSAKLAEQGETVFVWPEDYGKRFKDFNEMAVALGINEIPHKFILDNSHTGLKVRILLNMS